jgi:hypothetical protein
MFRRLAEAYQNGPQAQFAESQNQFFNAAPNTILSGTSGLKGFNVAIQSVDAYGRLESPPIKSADKIFLNAGGTSQNLDAMAQQCATSSIDELIAIKNPNAAIGCGWMYTPPPQGSPYPQKSQGFIGTVSGPLESYNPPGDYKKWYFDLQLAKKQQLLDKCKALKACSDVDSEVFNGTCGFCTDTNQGVPIDTVGQPLYGGDPLGGCNPPSIVTTGANCPVPGPAVGPQPNVNKTCVPVDGRLAADCLYSKLLTAGCSDSGSLAVALANPTSPSNYISNLIGSDAVKVYNRVANPPLNLNVFSQGATTIDVVLKEARQLAANATTAGANTALGAAARDLCLQSGAIAGFDFCSDLSDTTAPPFDMDCLQKIFRKMGGQPSGTAYPSVSNLTTYNSMGTLGAVKQFWTQMSGNMKSTDYGTQRQAMIQFLGISPDKLVTRAPYTQGVEVIWLMPRGGYPNTVWGILKRTIEPNIVQFPVNSTGIIPQLASTYPGFSAYVTMMQMFDLRTTTDFTTKFKVLVDDGFFVAVNETADVATRAFTSLNLDQVGLFANLQIQGATTYQSNNCSNYFAATPNITKIYYSDAGGYAHALQVTPVPCSGGAGAFSPQFYSLTLDKRAPFLNFEVNSGGDSFDDTRNPGLYSSLLVTNSLEFHNRTDERNFVPGKKGFVRIANGSGQIILQNIAYQAWGTMTFAFRLQTMPVKDTIFAFKVWNKFCYLYVVPVNGNTAQLRVQTNMTQNGTVFDGPTNWSFQLGNWYFLEVAQNGEGFDLFCDTIDNIVRAGNFTQGLWKILNNGPITTTQNNGLYLNAQTMCHYYVGGSMSGSGFFSSSFQFDLAWIHYYDYYIGAADVVKDCQAAWVFTQFPDSLNVYKAME